MFLRLPDGLDICEVLVHVVEPVALDDAVGELWPLPGHHHGGVGYRTEGHIVWPGGDWKRARGLETCFFNIK